MRSREEKQREKAERARRREICKTCPSATGGLIKACSFCQCPVVFVTSSGPCPLHKW